MGKVKKGAETAYDVHMRTNLISVARFGIAIDHEDPARGRELPIVRGLVPTHFLE